MSDRKLLVLVNGKQKQLSSATAEVDFNSVRIGASNLPITADASSFNFGSKKLTGLVAGVAGTDAATVSQLPAAPPSNTDGLSEGSTNLYFTNARAKAAAVADSITDSVTDVAPSQNAVFDALALKVNSSLLGANSGVATLDGSGKIPVGQLPASVMEFKGTFDPTGPTPALTNGTGDVGDVYRVSVAGSHDFGAGSISFVVGDWVTYSGSIWQKSAAGAEGGVQSVNGLSGTVTLTTTNIGEGTNLYYTQGRFDTAFAAKSTNELSEGPANKYYTSARFDADLATKNTDNLAESPTKKYYATSLFNTDFASKNTDGLTEGSTNKYYSSSLFNADLATKDTDDLAEGATNKYFSGALAKAAVVLDSMGTATDQSPSQNAVTDALALKTDLSADYVSGNTNDNAGAITVRQIAYFKSNGAVDLARANAAATAEAMLGVVRSASIASAGAGDINIQSGMKITGFSGLTPGATQYLSAATAGAITETAPSASGQFIVVVGRAVSATVMVFDPQEAIEILP